MCVRAHIYILHQLFAAATMSYIVTLVEYTLIIIAVSCVFGCTASCSGPPSTLVEDSLPCTFKGNDVYFAHKQTPLRWQPHIYSGMFPLDAYEEACKLYLLQTTPDLLLMFDENELLTCIICVARMARTHVDNAERMNRKYKVVDTVSYNTPSQRCRIVSDADVAVAQLIERVDNTN